MSTDWRTGPGDSWNVRHQVRCPGCRLTEWYGAPMHEKGCRDAKTWYALPADTPAWVRGHVETLDVSTPGRSPADFGDRQTLRGLAWVVRACWHNARTRDIGRFDMR